MISQLEFDTWLQEEEITTRPIENGVQFDSSNPHGDLDQEDDIGSIRLINGTIHIDWVDGGWNGYGEEKFNSITKFAKRFTHVMNHGLNG